MLHWYYITAANGDVIFSTAVKAASYAHAREVFGRREPMASIVLIER